MIETGLLVSCQVFAESVANFSSFATCPAGTRRGRVGHFPGSAGLTAQRPTGARAAVPDEVNGRSRMTVRYLLSTADTGIWTVWYEYVGCRYWTYRRTG
eukprot:scaffold69546_cov36-Prasinocladus_malaysianus.AAC.1